MARLFGGFFGGTAPALGVDTVVDIYLLHQRGKGLTALNLSFLGGVIVGPTLSGFNLARYLGLFNFGGPMVSKLLSSCSRSSYWRKPTTTVLQTRTLVAEDGQRLS